MKVYNAFIQLFKNISLTSNAAEGKDSDQNYFIKFENNTF